MIEIRVTGETLFDCLTQIVGKSVNAIQMGDQKEDETLPKEVAKKARATASRALNEVAKKKEEAKSEEPVKQEEPKTEEVKPEESKIEEPVKQEEPKVEEPKTEAPKTEEPKPEVANPSNADITAIARAAGVEVKEKLGLPRLKAIMTQMTVKKFSEIPAERHQEFLTLCNAALEEVE